MIRPRANSCGAPTPSPRRASRGATPGRGTAGSTAGRPTWLTGSYDPETNTLIWPTGNPGPDFNPDLRKGDNLYTDSVLALDADTGKLKWHYQFTPNDGHDWDSTEDMVLADQVIDGQPRKLVIHADRNGMFYVLDRTNGKFLFSTPFVRQTWNLGFDPTEGPSSTPDPCPTPPARPPFRVGHQLRAPSYDKDSGLLFVAFSDSQSLRSDPAVP
jgi:alcohol dehydrogenase (cytochrome c)